MQRCAYVILYLTDAQGVQQRQQAADGLLDWPQNGAGAIASAGGSVLKEIYRTPAIFATSLAVAPGPGRDGKHRDAELRAAVRDQANGLRPAPFDRRGRQRLHFRRVPVYRSGWHFQRQRRGAANPSARASRRARPRYRPHGACGALSKAYRHRAAGNGVPGSLSGIARANNSGPYDTLA